MDDDDRELSSTSSDLRRLLISKVGSDTRPATKSDLANFYVHLLLVNDFASAIFDLAIADDLDEKIEAMKNIRPVTKALHENFEEAIARLVASSQEGVGRGDDGDA